MSDHGPGRNGDSRFGSGHQSVRGPAERSREAAENPVAQDQVERGSSGGGVRAEHHVNSLADVKDLLNTRWPARVQGALLQQVVESNSRYVLGKHVSAKNKLAMVLSAYRHREEPCATATAPCPRLRRVLAEATAKNRALEARRRPGLGFQQQDGLDPGRTCTCVRVEPEPPPLSESVPLDRQDDRPRPAADDRLGGARASAFLGVGASSKKRRLRYPAQLTLERQDARPRPLTLEDKTPRPRPLTLEKTPRPAPAEDRPGEPETGALLSSRCLFKEKTPPPRPADGRLGRAEPPPVSLPVLSSNTTPLGPSLNQQLPGLFHLPMKSSKYRPWFCMYATTSS
ncbi:hypothetical protein Q5P01_000320 [Channa striata]|uniref:Uncharacterized protein n=1 Tax=Channa striata TaxID=64152 RepID=A0AA88IHS1_CHASR|nr:hypothetical protein Q5P01_000320 [Channa striata]